MEALYIINKLPHFILLPFKFKVLSLYLKLIIKVLSLQSPVDRVEGDGILNIHTRFPVSLFLGLLLSILKINQILLK